VAEDQAKLQQAFNTAIGQSIDLLRDQLRLQLELNASKGGSADVASQMRQIESSLGNISRRGGSAYSAGSRGAANWSQANQELSFGMSGLDGQLQGLARTGIQAFDQIGQAVDAAVPDEARKAYGEIQEMFGGLRDLTSEGNTQAGQARNAFTKLYQTYARDSGEILKDSGQKIPLYAAFNSASDMAERFNYLIKNESIDAIAALRSTNKDLARDMALLGEGLNYTSAETSTFIKREISLFGTATGKMLSDAAKYAKAMEGATGISSKIIAQNIEGIMADTKTFGNVTVEEAARMSASLAQLNLDYGAVNQTVAQFQTFEQAASAVGQLTSVFGVHLDALELTRLANEDQEAFLHRIRDQFLATGKSVETMSRAEKAFLADTLQLSDVEAVERLFASGPEAALSSMDQLASATKAATDLSPDQVLASMGENIRSIDDASQITFNRLRAQMQKTWEGPFVEQLVQAERAWIATTLDEFSGLQKGVGQRVVLIQKELERLKDTNASWSESDTQRYMSFWAQGGSELTAAWTSNNREVSQAVTTGVLARYREEFSVSEASIADGLTSGLNNWASAAVAEGTSAFNRVESSPAWGYWQGKSESLAGKDLRIGLQDGLDAFGVGAESAFNKIQSRWLKMFKEIRESPEFEYWKGRSLSPAMKEILTGHDALIVAQSKSQKDFWSNVGTMSNDTLTKQLKSTESLVSKTAALLGRHRIDMKNLDVEDQKATLARFKITKDQIDEIQSSAAYKSSQGWSESEDQVTSMFKMWRSEYKDINKIFADESHMGWLQEKLGLDEAGVRSLEAQLGNILSGKPGDTGSQIETALVAARKRQDAAKAASSTTAPTVDNTSGTTNKVNNISSNQNAANAALTTAANKLQIAAVALENVSTSSSSSTSAPTSVTVNIDNLGNAIMEFIIEKEGLPGGGGTSGKRIVTDNAGNIST
jgi:hypothetical protein